MIKPNFFHAINPENNQVLPGEYINSSKKDIDEKVKEASIAFKTYRKKDKNNIAIFLEEIGKEINNIGTELLEICNLETALPIGRLSGEKDRTVKQLQLFAEVIREGSWVDARIDTAIPDRKPTPRPDIRHTLIPIGPVAVFGASNFPLAFSVAGGDTASALAAGCTVIFKAHPAHPGTSDLIAQAIHKAIKTCEMPQETFTLVHGNTNSVGEWLVKHPKIKAVGFTGSTKGGTALFKLANNRSEPIPVFAEMGSSNPVFILPEALQKNNAKIAEELTNAVTLGVGQFCTSPGLTFIQNSSNADKFTSLFEKNIKGSTPGTMLTHGIIEAYSRGVSKIIEFPQTENIAKGACAPDRASAYLFKTTAENFIENKDMENENFGPSNILVTASTKKQLIETANQLKGHLTATVHCTEKDIEAYKELFDVLETKVGRVIINGYPTGVEVCHSMVHGGPYPATTAPQSTSVGTNAIKRFVRPVCFQDYPDILLPESLQNENKGHLWRLINGNHTQKEIN